MIPKIIHYCWFGRNEKSGLIKECIASWRKYLPDYEIIEWNEDNFDINCNTYVKQAYEAKKWAFVSDYARLWVLYNYGGVYFDTDVEVRKNFNRFLTDKMFTGYESKDSPITATFGAEKGQPLVKELLDYYSDKTFILNNGKQDTTTNTVIITDILLNNGLKPNGKKKTISGLTIYPQIYFCPNNISRIWDKVSNRTYAIHHFDQSWKSERTNQITLKGKIRRYIVGVARNTIGTKRLGIIRNIL